MRQVNGNKCINSEGSCSINYFFSSIEFLAGLILLEASLEMQQQPKFMIADHTNSVFFHKDKNNFYFCLKLAVFLNYSECLH